MSGAAVYFDMLDKAIPGLQYLHGCDDHEIADMYTAITSIRDEFAAIYERHRAGEMLQSKEQSFLSLLGDALTDLCDGLQNEDGSIRRKAESKLYFSGKLDAFIAAANRSSNS